MVLVLDASQALDLSQSMGLNQAHGALGGACVACVAQAEPQNSYFEIQQME